MGPSCRIVYIGPIETTDISFWGSKTFFILMHFLCNSCFWLIVEGRQFYDWRLQTNEWRCFITWSQIKTKEWVSCCRKWSDFEGNCIRVAIIITTPYFNISNVNRAFEGSNLRSTGSAIASHIQLKLRSSNIRLIDGRKYYNKVWLLLNCMLLYR